MPSFVIPPDNRSVGTGNPPQDVNQLSDMEGLIAQVVAGFGGYPGGSSIPADNAANVTAVQSLAAGNFPGAGLAPSGDTSGVTDTASINGVLALCGTALLQAGTFYVDGPVVPPSGGLIQGRKGCSAAGADAAVATTPGTCPGATVIRPVAAWSTTYSTSGVITLPNSSTGTHIRDLWIAGLSTSSGSTGPAGLDGICTNGASGASAVCLQNVGSIWNTGNGIAFYAGDGIHMTTCYAGNNLGHGIVPQVPDCTFVNVHAQSNGQSGTAGDGFYKINANSRLIACRADLNQNGFTVDGADGGGYLDSVLLVGCGTQRNNFNGLNVVNSSTAGNGQRDPVIAAGCSFFADGQNGTNSPGGITGGTGGGGYAGVAVAGRNVVQLTGTNVLAGTVDVAGGCPQYGLATALAGTLNVPPARIQVSGGTLNAVTGLVNDAAGVGSGIRWSPVTDQATGGMYYSETPVPVRLSEYHAGLFGDGSDGAVTLDGTTAFSGWSSLAGGIYTMTRDVYCTSLTVNSGVTLKCSGWRIFCAGSVANAGTISANGNAGSASGTAGGGSGSGANSGGRAGGAGGTGAGTAASASGFAVAAAGGAGGLGSGGGGGAGASGSPFAGWYKVPQYLLTGAISVTASLSQIAGGGGGGGGGGDGTAGGGGGGGGGIVPVFAWSVVNTGTISATGGAGGSPAGGNRGGGGGGAGGLIIAYTLSAWTAGTTAVTGGAGGTATGTGVNGGSGNSGTVANVVVA